MSHVMRKPVFWVFDQVRLKQGLEISDIEIGDIMLSRQ